MFSKKSFLVVCIFLLLYLPPAFSLSPSLDLGHSENTPLYWGNPSDASSAPSPVASPENFLMEKPQFTLSYNDTTHNPNWVAWHLCHADLGDADRANNFRPDPELPASFYAVRKADYKFTAYGFDRGHLCPSADRTATAQDNSETFLMTNMVPQSPDNNRIVWVALEKFEREMVLQGYEAYIFAGPYGRGGSGDRGYFEAIPIDGPGGNGKVNRNANGNSQVTESANGDASTHAKLTGSSNANANSHVNVNGNAQVTASSNGGANVNSHLTASLSVDGATSSLEIQVPSHTWKIILFMPEGEGDFSRLDQLWTNAQASDESPDVKSVKVLAVNVPNVKGCAQAASVSTTATTTTTTTAANSSWQQYICTVNYIEEITGYDFFELLPDELEEEIESHLFSW